MPIALTAHDAGYSQMDHPAQQIIDLARAGDIAAAVVLLTSLIRSGHLSGQDQQGTERAIAEAREQLATEERRAAQKATKPKRPAAKRTVKV